MIKSICAVICLFLLSDIAVAAQPKQVEQLKKESSMTYKMVHPLHEIEATSKEAVYKVELDVAKQKIESVSADVDVTTFDSGNSNRDSHAMEVIDAITFPEASFVSSSITQSGDSLKVAGKITFHGVTRDVVIDAVTTWSTDRVEVRGKFVLSLTAFSIERPSLLMIPVEDALRFAFVAAFGLH